MTSSFSSQRQRLSELANDSIAAWSCCYLRNAGNSMNGSGVIVEFDVPHTELRAHLPGLQKLSSPPETRYALLTCHHIIPDLQSATQGGWSLCVGPGKKVSLGLGDIVCGVVSCCGENGVISSGDLRLNKWPVIVSHQTECCSLNLDFTMLFLNKSFEEKLVKEKCTPKLPQVHIPNSSVVSDPQALFSQIESNTASGTEVRMQLYHVHREELEVVSLPVNIEIDRSLATSTGDDQQLKNEVAEYKKYQRIHYTASGDIVEGYSGSALVSYNPNTKKTQLVGIHVGAMSSDPKCYIGVSIHGIIELLRGHPAAFFAVMERSSARLMWIFRWAHLLTHRLEKCRDTLPLGYLVEILQQLLDKSKKKTGLIRINLMDLPRNVLATLQLLSSIFKCFERFGTDDVAIAIRVAFADNEKEIKKFEEDLADLPKSFPDLLVDVGVDEEMAKACSECFNIMLKFKYKGIVQGVLHSGESLAFLGKLQLYNCPEILRNFIAILRFYHQTKENELAEGYETELQQLKQRLKEERETELQQLEQCLKEKHETELQQLKRENEAQLQKELQKQMVRLEQQMKNAVAKTNLSVSRLQAKNQRLQQSVERQKKEKGGTVAASEQHCREVTKLRGELEQMREEKQDLEGKVQQLEQHKKIIENELRETRQKIHQQSAKAKEEAEKWRSRVAEYERQMDKLSEELKQSKEEYEKVDRQLEEIAISY